MTTTLISLPISLYISNKMQKKKKLKFGHLFLSLYHTKVCHRQKRTALKIQGPKFTKHLLFLAIFWLIF